MDIHIELQDTDVKFSLFASSTYELTFGGLSVHMNSDQFQQLCDNLRPWVVDDTTPQPSADAVREVIGSMRNFADVADKCELTESNAQVAIRAWATQLESLLSGEPHA